MLSKIACCAPRVEEYGKSYERYLPRGEERKVKSVREEGYSSTELMAAALTSYRGLTGRALSAEQVKKVRKIHKKLSPYMATFSQTDRTRLEIIGSLLDTKEGKPLKTDLDTLTASARLGVGIGAFDALESLEIQIKSLPAGHVKDEAERIFQKGPVSSLTTHFTPGAADLVTLLEKIIRLTTFLHGMKLSQESLPKYISDLIMAVQMCVKVLNCGIQIENRRSSPWAHCLLTYGKLDERSLRQMRTDAPDMSRRVRSERQAKGKCCLCESEMMALPEGKLNRESPFCQETFAALGLDAGNTEGLRRANSMRQRAGARTDQQKDLVELVKSCCEETYDQGRGIVATWAVMCIQRAVIPEGDQTPGNGYVSELGAFFQRSELPTCVDEKEKMLSTNEAMMWEKHKPKRVEGSTKEILFFGKIYDGDDFVDKKRLTEAKEDFAEMMKRGLDPEVYMKRRPWDLWEERARYRELGTELGTAQANMLRDLSERLRSLWMNIKWEFPKVARVKEVVVRGIELLEDHQFGFMHLRKLYEKSGVFGKSGLPMP